MRGSIVIIKLGGAAITDKAGTCQLADDQALDVLVKQIQTAFHNLSEAGHQLILIHGAGSFGHPQAKRFGLKEGWLVSPNNDMTAVKAWKEQKAGFAHTRKCLLDLHTAILARLHDVGVPVLSVSPFDHIETEGGPGCPTACFTPLAKRVSSCLQLGFVPLLHGDAIFDSKLGCTILSGDVVMHQLAMLLPNVTRCVFLTDVEGIYDSDPKQKTKKRAKLIRHIKVDINKELLTPLAKHQSRTHRLERRQQQQQEQIKSIGVAENGVIDVTGGMGGKIKRARQIIREAALHLKRNDVTVVICKAGSKEALFAMGLEPVMRDGEPIQGQQMTVFSLGS